MNADDEAEFEAKLAPDDGKLELDVDFYKRGMSPRGADHSEGHQPGLADAGDADREQSLMDLRRGLKLRRCARR